MQKIKRQKAAINLIGLALKGGNAAVGRDPARIAVHRQRAVHLFLAHDAGVAVADEMRLLGEKQGVPVTVLGSKETLGQIAGRMEVAVVVVTDKGLADAIYEATARSGGHTDDGADSRTITSDNVVRRQV